MATKRASNKSDQVVWVVVAVVVIALGLWWSGMISVAPSDQGAAVGASGASSDVGGQDISLKNDLKAIDKQMGNVATTIAAFGTSTTRIQISQAKKAIFMVNMLTGKLITKMQARSTNNKSAGGVALDASVIADLQSHLSNATSYAGAGDKNSANAPGDPVVLAQAAAQIKSSYNDLVAARADLKTLFTSFNIQ